MKSFEREICRSEEMLIRFFAGPELKKCRIVKTWSWRAISLCMRIFTETSLKLLVPIIDYVRHSNGIVISLLFLLLNFVWRNTENLMRWSWIGSLKKRDSPDKRSDNN
ncbi:hypothetical protein EJA13_11190 [Bacillus canaveralius]|nr:hypothetical protein EJA13_11190 [Bacillus canaveralius]